MKQKLMNIVQNKEYRNLLLIAAYISLAFFMYEYVQEKPRYRMALFLSLAFLLPVFLFPKQVKLYFMLYFAFIYVPTLINVTHILIFGEEIDPASIRCIFDTNWREAAEFLQTFCSWKLWGLVVLLLVFAGVAISRVRPANKLSPRFVKIMQRLCFIALMLTIFKGAYTYYDRSNQIPTLALRDELHTFRQEIKTMLKLRKNMPDYHFRNIKSALPDSEPQTYVLVIGESLNRGHMGLYGYKRDTTPRLDDMKDELIVFDNVYSPHAATLMSLTKVLSFANRGAEQLAFVRGSIVDYFKAAGFKTFWISNQFDTGGNDDLLGVWGHAADKSAFINRSYWRKLNAPYDEKVLPEYQAALADKAPKKFIVVHLMGSHSTYDKRFPKEFAKFSGDNPRAEKVAQYDNSVLYNDFVVSSLIDMLRKTGRTSALLYLSDHGEDISEAEDSCHCHSEVVATKEMFEIPFIIWSSDKYRQKRPEMMRRLKQTRKRLFNSENLIHAYTDLAGLENKDINDRLNVFSNRYEKPEKAY